MSGLTTNRAVQQIARRNTNEEIDPSIRVALQNLQNQINYLANTALPQILETVGGNYDAEGNQFVAAPVQPEIQLTNKSLSGRVLGDVVVFDTANSKAFTTTTTANDENVVGCVSSDSPDGTTDAVLVDAEGTIAVAGKAFCNVNAGTAIAIGDYLVAGTTATQAVKAVSPYAPGIFARALEAKASGVGIIEVEIISPDVETNANEAVQNGCLEPFYDADGTATGFSGLLTSATMWRTSAKALPIWHQVLNYSGGSLISYTISTYQVNGTSHVIDLNAILSYSSARISQIIQELS